MAENKRESNIDCLRILCMLMVVCNHIISWGGLLEYGIEPMSPIWLVGNTFFVFLLPAVNCFVLISGYFLCTAEFKLKKLVSLWVQTIFYSVGIYLIVCIFSDKLTFSFTGFIKSCLVITMRHYWFVTAYVLLYIVFPFLNCAIRAMGKRFHELCCIVLLGVFSVMSNLMYIVDFTSVYGGYSFLWFCIMYIVAAYIRLYVPVRIKHQRWMFPISALCSLMICGEKYIAYLVTPHLFGSVVLDGFFYSYNSILAVPCALALFQGFRGIQIKSPVCNKIIGFFAPLTFAAYLIHGHPNFRSILLDTLNANAYVSSLAVFPYIIICALGVVIASSAIEWLRQLLFRKCGITGVINKVCDRIQSKTILWLRGDAGQIHS